MHAAQESERRLRERWEEEILDLRRLIAADQCLDPRLVLVMTLDLFLSWPRGDEINRGSFVIFSRIAFFTDRDRPGWHISCCYTPLFAF